MWRSTLAVALLLAAGCSPPPPSPVQHVALWLDAAAFPGIAKPRHGPVAQIGDEARHVIVAPAELPVAEPLGVHPERGVARARVQLPAALEALPDSAFLLSVQALPFTAELEPELGADLARKAFWRKLDTGWHLERSAEDRGRATLVVQHEGSEQVQLNLRLVAVLPPPESLASIFFNIPKSAHLSLGFGLVNPRDAVDRLEVRFIARLECNEGETQEIVDRLLSLAEPGSNGWHDVLVGLEPGASCRLLLSVRAEDGSAARGAVWSVAKILAPDPSKQEKNLVLVSLDTLRADRLSGYGYARPTSPRIDAELIARGTTFSDVIATFPQTDISHLSIFSGLYPGAQPVRGRVSPEDRLVLLAEVLQGKGFETAAVTEDALVSGGFGFWFGFDRFIERSVVAADRGEKTVAAALRYLESHRDRRFFLFLHTYKTHDPYLASEPYQPLWSDAQVWKNGGPAPLVPPRYRALVDQYDRTVREADDLVGRVLATLDSSGLAGRTIVAVLSDHGEAFGEHGVTGHGFAAHQEQLAVPLILRGPGIPAGMRITAPASLVDVAPTLLDLLDLDPLQQAQGISLAPALAGQPLPASRSLYFSWLRRDAEGVRQGAKKLLRSALGHELFDLSKDPREWSPLRGAEAERAAEQRLLDAHAADNATRRARLAAEEKPHPPAISERTEESLRALGYLK